MKMTVKSLGEEIMVIKEQLKEIKTLKQTVKDLRKELQELKSSKEKTNDGTEELRCKKCDEPFNSLKFLKKHLLQVHPITLNCNICDKTFLKNHELEEHMEEHAEEKKFKCEVCHKEFYLEWRLKKHGSVHSDQTKICQNFSRGVQCPFELVGCKFKHEHHTTDTIETLDMSTEAIEEVSQSNDNEKEPSEEICENQCHLCMKQLANRSDLLDHFRSKHVHFYTLMNNRTMN
jgi:uncharacterized C2H2 Zn-finger protein